MSLPSFPTTAAATPPPPRLEIPTTDIGLGYTIALALGFLVLISTLILSSYLCCRSHHRNRGPTPPSHPPHHPHPSSSSDGGIVLPRIIFVADDDEEDRQDDTVVGLHQSIINSYPKFPYKKKKRPRDAASAAGEVVDESNRWAMCSICLCEYKEGEILRMMPDCRHLFHLCCLDAWLRLKGSCPVCRNSPLPTPLSTPLAEVVPLSQYPDNRRRS